MTGERIVVRELEEQRLTLSRVESDFLLLRHHRHLQLRPVPGEREEWVLRAAEYCGVIALPGGPAPPRPPARVPARGGTARSGPRGRALHIEPKAHIGNLWRLLSIAYRPLDLDERRVGLASCAELVESLAVGFVEHCERILAGGLLHGYRPREEWLRSLRGRLDLSRMMRAGPPARHLLACRYDDYTADTVENRILKNALERLSRSGGADRALRARAEACARGMAGVPSAQVTAYDFSLLHFDALNRHYRTPLALAELLLGGRGVTHRPGETDLPPLLLHLPSLFERFVAELLERALGGGLRAHRHAHAIALDDAGRLPVTPDLLITREGRPVCVVDAKYKLPASGSRRSAPAADDAYQMLAYCVACGVPDAVLVYPERPEPLRPEPLTVTRPGLTVRIHAAELDLTGDRSGFEAECARVVRVVGRVVERAEV